jgi:hypothetical protein
LELQILPWINNDGNIDEGPGRPVSDQQLPAVFFDGISRLELQIRNISWALAYLSPLYLIAS